MSVALTPISPTTATLNGGTASQVLTGGVETGGSKGPIATSVLHTAAGGTGYIAGDTGKVSGGDVNATYVVDTVSTGAVLTYHLSSGGSGYAVATNVATTTSGSQPGIGTGFAIDISTVTPENEVTWSSSDATIASVSPLETFGAGSPVTVSAHKAGSATITATADDGSTTRTASITVSGKSVLLGTGSIQLIQSLMAQRVQDLAATSGRDALEIDKAKAALAELQQAV